MIPIAFTAQCTRIGNMGSKRKLNTQVVLPTGSVSTAAVSTAAVSTAVSNTSSDSC